MKVSILRIGHRFVRDDRITTHAALVSRAFGADGIFMTEVDQSIKKTVSDISERWGSAKDFKVQVIDDWKNVIKKWKKEGGKVVHLTMYGININGTIISEINNYEDILVVIGAEKVPREVYDIADYNVAIGNQPHSEIAALAIFLDRIFHGQQFENNFKGGRLKIIPMHRGKRVKEMENENK